MSHVNDPRWAKLPIHREQRLDFGDAWPAAEPNPTPGRLALFRDKAERTWGISFDFPRLHIRTLTEAETPRRIWLEGRNGSGTGVFEPEVATEQVEVDDLWQRSINIRLHLEAIWLRHMMRTGWISGARLREIVRITAYGGTPNEFVREVDLDAELPGAKLGTCGDVAYLDTDAGTLVACMGDDPVWNIDLRWLLWP